MVFYGMWKASNICFGPAQLATGCSGRQAEDQLRLGVPNIVYLGRARWHRGDAPHGLMLEAPGKFRRVCAFCAGSSASALGDICCRFGTHPHRQSDFLCCVRYVPQMPREPFWS